jgi:hypothetical protein
MSKQSTGGKITAAKLRNEALTRYYADPNRCLLCDKIIDVTETMKVKDARAKKFCNLSCATSYRNTKRS